MTSFNKRTPINFSFDDSQYQSFIRHTKPNTDINSIRQINTSVGLEFENVTLSPKAKHKTLAAIRFRTLN